MFLKFRSGTPGLFEELGMIRVVGQRSVLIARLVRNRLSMFFLSVYHIFPRDQIFLKYLKTVLPPDAFKTISVVVFLIILHLFRRKGRYVGKRGM